MIFGAGFPWCHPKMVPSFYLLDPSTGLATLSSCLSLCRNNRAVATVISQFHGNSRKRERFANRALRALRFTLTITTWIVHTLWANGHSQGNAMYWWPRPTVTATISWKQPLFHVRFSQHIHNYFVRSRLRYHCVNVVIEHYQREE